MKVGAHVSTAGGLANAFDRALEIGAEAIQIFGAPPQSWRITEHGDADVERFRARMAETGIEPAFIHAAYLINLGTPDATLLSRSLGSLKFGLELCSRIGAAGLIFHVGSHKGRGFDAVRGQIVESVLAALAATPDDAILVLENSAGMGGSVGSKFAELGAIMRGADSPRVKACLDTQHCYAAGYDVASREGLEATVEEFEREVGLDALVAVHANDSKIPLAGGVDRHENIGEGEIGREGFLAIMGHRAFRGVPFLLEVPGFEKKGPDKANVDILRELRRESGADP